MSTRKFKVPDSLTREASIVVNRVEGDAKSASVRVSISSDAPYMRFDWETMDYYWEVLDHTKMHTERLDAGLSALYNHDTDQHLGRATTYRCDGKRCDVGDIIWSESEFAQTKKKDMESGALPFTSVGYRIDDEGEVIGEKDGYPVVSFGFTPHEFSLVPVPADISVGAGRSIEELKKNPPAQFREIQVREKKSVDGKPNTPQKATTSKTMATATDPEKPELTVEVVAERERQAVETHKKAEKARVTAIRDFTKNFNRKANLKTPIEQLEAQAIDGDMDPDAYRALVLDNWTDAQRVEGADADPNIGMSPSQIKEFSFCKFYLEASSAKGLTGFEKEVCDTAAAKYRRDNNRPFSGHCVPQDILTADFAEINGMGRSDVANLYQRVTQAERMLGRSQNATSFTAGGFTVGVNLLAGSYIDLLRNATLIGNGPFSIIEINGATGNIAIPKQTSTLTTYWLAEGATVSESNFAGGQLLFSPKRLVSRNSYTKQLLAQGTPSIEMLVRNDMALAQGVEEDRAIIQGTGLNGEPLGIINTSGVGANVTFSGNWTWAKTLLFESSLENANVRTGEMVFLTSPTTKGYAKATPVVASSTFPIFIWMGSKGEFPTINGVKGGIVNEYGAYATKNATANVLFGVFNNNVTKVRWAGMDIVVDPYTGSASELVYITQTQWLDVGIRYPQAFEYSVDAPTSP